MELLLRDTLQMLGKAARHMPALQPQEERLRSCMIELKDLGDELEGQADAVLIDGERLQFIQERLSTLYALQQKHRLPDPDGLVGRMQELEAELTASSRDEEWIEALRNTCENLLVQLSQSAESLRKGRQLAIPRVQEKTLDLLDKVGMPGSRLEIRLDPLPAEAYRADGGTASYSCFPPIRGRPPNRWGRWPRVESCPGLCWPLRH